MKALEWLDGYLPIEDHGLIGDGATAALVSRDGKIVWLCLPRFDSPALFCSLLDVRRGGHLAVTLEDLQESRQFYELDSAVLVTEMRSGGGLIRLTDCCPLRNGADLTEDLQATRGELLRSVEVLSGEVRLRIEIEPRGGAEAEARDGGLRVRCTAQPELMLKFLSSAPLKGLCTVISLKKGESFHLLLRWRQSHGHVPSFDARRLHNDTTVAWKQWLTHLKYHGPQEDLVRRSAITLKLLDHFESGAIVAAPTSSLPEHIGGVRNWDYRYAWVRDAAFSVYALHRIGLSHEAAAFLSWLLDAAERKGAARIMYTLNGNRPPDEVDDPELEGYRRSKPVRWGNAAADQNQHDVYGEILDCAYQWTAHHGSMPERLWSKLSVLAAAAGREWRMPDQGIWEVRTSGRPFTYSAALCQVALDRAARMAERFDLAGPRQLWREMADDIGRAILKEAWDARANALTEHLGGGSLDASLLALPLRRVVPADHPKMVATTRAICDRLGAGKGLLYRYRYEESPDGITGKEGAFLLCSFWLVDNLAKQGRVDEAMELYESLCARAGHLGLLPEEIDPTTGSSLGNYPQAFSHIGVIASGVNLARVWAKGGRGVPSEQEQRA
ncbi:glycoside hydrolase family 15 protein [Nitrospira sp. Nam74]